MGFFALLFNKNFVCLDMEIIFGFFCFARYWKVFLFDFFKFLLSVFFFLGISLPFISIFSCLNIDIRGLCIISI